MTLETWKAEFYPTPAEENISSDVMALEHSLNKWKGLTSENLMKHSIVHLDGSMIISFNAPTDEVLWITGDTCALCQRHMKCTGCPIEGACQDNNELSAYDTFIECSNPYPMIERLEHALKDAKSNLT